ncbi:LysR family transcriptional regulator [Vibrio jasicida]|uniref:LysR family transcriptional regulator n=1 Tax=Vibrio jasicida TaxID=766224 RepID=A0ABW7JFZ8_9VIBR
MKKIPTTIKRLEVFVAYMDKQNMSTVAEHLGINMLSVYRSIHGLEEDLGCRLFEKKGRNLVPMASAEVLYSKMNSILGDLNSAIDNAKFASGIEPDSLRVGSINSLTIDLIPHLLASYAERQPDVKLIVSTGSNISLLARLNKSELDAVLLYDEKLELDSSYTTLPIFDDVLTFSVAKSSPQPEQIPVTDEYLAAQTYMTLESGFGLRGFSNSVMRHISDKFNIQAEFSSIFSLSYALQAGNFATFLPSRLASIADNFNLNLYPLANSQQGRHTIQLIVNKACENNLAIKALLAECRMYTLQWEKKP